MAGVSRSGLEPPTSTKTHVPPRAPTSTALPMLAAALFPKTTITSSVTDLTPGVLDRKSYLLPFECIDIVSE